MNIAAVFFVLAALGGITMLIIRLRGAPRPPTWMALGHGVIALCGLVTLGYAFMQGSLPVFATYALACFVLAALGGATIFALFHLRGRPLPVPMILGHGLIAATGLGLLLKTIYG